MFVQFKNVFSTDDHHSIPSASSQHTLHSSPQHHHQHFHSNAIIANTSSYSQHPQHQHHQLQQQQPHHQQQQHQQTQHLHPQHITSGSSINSVVSHHNNPVIGGATSAASQSAAAAAAAVAGYSDEFFVAPDFNEAAGQSEHYIYVTYPPELKRRLLERYGRDIYLNLLRKDMYY